MGREVDRFDYDQIRIWREPLGEDRLVRLHGEVTFGWHVYPLDGGLATIAQTRDLGPEINELEALAWIAN